MEAVEGIRYKSCFGSKLQGYRKRSINIRIYVVAWHTKDFVVALALKWAFMHEGACNVLEVDKIVP